LIHGHPHAIDILLEKLTTATKDQKFGVPSVKVKRVELDLRHLIPYGAGINNTILPMEEQKICPTESAMRAKNDVMQWSVS
jgi:hypothetical protein